MPSITDYIDSGDDAKPPSITDYIQPAPTPTHAKVYSRADELGLPRDLVNGIASTESGWSHKDKNGRVIRSSKNALGLLQVVGEKGGHYRTIGGKQYDLLDEDQNIEAGLNYLKEGYEYGGGDPKIASLYYFGGPGAARRLKASGKVPNISDGGATASQYINATTRNIKNPSPQPSITQFFKPSTLDGSTDNEIPQPSSSVIPENSPARRRDIRTPKPPGAIVGGENGNTVYDAQGNVIALNARQGHTPLRGEPLDVPADIPTDVPVEAPQVGQPASRPIGPQPRTVVRRMVPRSQANKQVQNQALNQAANLNRIAEELLSENAQQNFSKLGLNLNPQTRPAAPISFKQPKGFDFAEGQRTARGRASKVVDPAAFKQRDEAAVAEQERLRNLVREDSALSAAETAIPGVVGSPLASPLAGRIVTRPLVEGVGQSVAGTLKAVGNLADVVNIGPESTKSPTLARAADALRSAAGDMQQGAQASDVLTPAQGGEKFTRNLFRGVGSTPLTVAKFEALGVPAMVAEGGLSRADEGVGGVLKGAAESAATLYGMQATGKVLSPLWNGLTWTAIPTAKGVLIDHKDLSEALGESIPGGALAGYSAEGIEKHFRSRGYEPYNVKAEDGRTATVYVDPQGTYRSVRSRGVKAGRPTVEVNDAIFDGITKGAKLGQWTKGLVNADNLFDVRNKSSVGNEGLGGGGQRAIGVAPRQIGGRVEDSQPDVQPPEAPRGATIGDQMRAKGQAPLVPDAEPQIAPETPASVGLAPRIPEQPQSNVAPETPHYSNGQNRRVRNTKNGNAGQFTKGFKEEAGGISTPDAAVDSSSNTEPQTGGRNEAMAERTPAPVRLESTQGGVAPSEGAKQPYEMGRDEYNAYVSNLEAERTGSKRKQVGALETASGARTEWGAMVDGWRKAEIKSALEAGKPIPPEVLADYPDLQSPGRKQAEEPQGVPPAAQSELAVAPSSVEQPTQGESNAERIFSSPSRVSDTSVRPAVGSSEPRGRVQPPGPAGKVEVGPHGRFSSLARKSYPHPETNKPLPAFLTEPSVRKAVGLPEVSSDEAKSSTEMQRTADAIAKRMRAPRSSYLGPNGFQRFIDIHKDKLSNNAIDAYHQTS
jgi:hypothetical protein